MKSNLSYNHQEIEKKWQKIWEKENIYSVDVDKDKNPYYLLVELTYTSGDLHMGHWFAWTAPDIYARFKRMQGYDVLFPVGGFDAFGLPAENAAIKHGIHPKVWTYKNIKKMREQFKSMGPSFDWEKEVITCDPGYYRFNQWLFILLFKNGLAYRAKVWSNWCPECKSVLANEHVENGCCWRHTSTFVEQKLVDQWLFRITEYADKLIWPKKPKVDWPKSCIEGQNNWIGKSEGVDIKFKVQNSNLKIEVFTTRPETIFGATFLVLAPEHPLSLKIASEKNKDEVKKYIKESLKKLERVRLEQSREKTGVFTGNYAINPLTKEKIPIWIADFVLGSYGKGAVMGVPGHDSRDWEFAKKFNLNIKTVIKAKATKNQAYEGEGILINSHEFSGLSSKLAKKKISEYLIKKGFAKKSVQYHLRDWTISRQRYWGAPIPMIFCQNCASKKKSWFTQTKINSKLKSILNWNHFGWYPVEESELPVILPENVDYTPTGKPPLATAKDWVKVECPECKSLATREVETMDTYVDSSWYFFRYPTPKNEKFAFDKKVVNKWMPIKIYFGGPEHILGHTLYARFITKYFYDLKLINFDEFALRRFHHGVILGPDGYRMSKSRGNVVNPDEQVRKFGADAVRVYIAFLGPHDKGGAWKTEGIEGSYRFLNKVFRLFIENRDIYVSKKDARPLYAFMHKTIRKVTKDIEKIQTNTALAAIMEYLNFLKNLADKNSKFKAKKNEGKSLAEGRRKVIRCSEWDEALRTLIYLLAPFAPHLTEEIYQKYFSIGSKFVSVHLQSWPKYVEELTFEKKVNIAVQVNGKLRSVLNIEKGLAKEGVTKLAKKDPKVKKWLEGKKVKSIIFVPDRIINFVV